jgi:anti-sigma factor RsiW
MNLRHEEGERPATICTGYEPRLGPCLDGELEAEERRAVLDHVASCAACGSRYRAIERLDRIARSFAAAPPVTGAEWSLRGGRIAALTNSSAPFRLFGGAWLAGLAAAAAALVAATIVLPLVLGTPGAAPPEPAAPAPPVLAFRDEPGANAAEVMYLSFDGKAATILYPEDDSQALRIELSPL